MKIPFLSVLILFMLNNSTAQSTEAYKQVAGRYGGNDGICLFDDGTFMLYGYATIVLGNYQVENEFLHFYPDIPELFLLYATCNKNIGDNTRMQFQGFQEGKTFVRFNNDPSKRVFNDNANCFSGPYVYETRTIPRQITLTHEVADEWEENQSRTESRVFNIKEGFNDFIMVYNEPERYYEPFNGIIERTADGEQILKPSGNFGDRGIVKQKFDEDEKRQWQEILELKTEYYETKMARQQEVFANKHYKIFPRPDSLVYYYDAIANQYISKWAADNEAHYRDNQYHDDRYLQKYTKVIQVRIDTNSIDKQVVGGSVFYSSCEEDQPSYRYNGLANETNGGENSTITVPAPIEGVTPGTLLPPRVNNQPYRLENLIPFAVDRKDGFYTINKIDSTNTKLPELALRPAISKADINTITATFDQMGQPVVVIRFTKSGSKKFHQVSTANVGKQLVIVVDKTVVSAPKIDSPIKEDFVNLWVGYTIEDAQKFADTLNRLK